MHSLRVILAFMLVLSMAACGSKSKRNKSKSSGANSGSNTGDNASRRASTTGPGGQLFITALGRIVATDATRKAVRFSDNITLGDIGGQWQALIGYGAAELIPVETKDPQGYGIRYARTRYTVTAGIDPKLVILSGGQDAAQVKTALTAKGWTADGDRLVAPKKSADAATTAAAGLYPVVRTAGPDVLIGKDATTLDAVATDPAKSLAADPAVRALADCLGAVVLAQYARTPADTVAIGVPRPAAGGKVHAVVCSSHPTAAAATEAAARQRTAYATGAPATAYQAVDVTVTGTVVRVDAVIAGPTTILDAFTQQNLPGLKLR